MKFEAKIRVDWLMAVIMLSGITLAISDGAWFPYLNLVGVVIFGVCGIIGSVYYDG